MPFSPMMTDLILRSISGIAEDGREILRRSRAARPDLLRDDVPEPVDRVFALILSYCQPQAARSPARLSACDAVILSEIVDAVRCRYGAGSETQAVWEMVTAVLANAERMPDDSAAKTGGSETG